MTNPVYGTQTYPDGDRGIVSVTPKLVLNKESPEFNISMSTLNYGAIASWYKLKSPPTYKGAWQALSMIVDKMNTQSFQTYYYALYAFEKYYSV